MSALIPTEWGVIGGQIANHLWQSTLFAAMAGLLAFAFRKNHARTRHWLWMAASLKFFAPFALIVAIGAQLGHSPVPRSAAPSIPAVAEQIVRPFPLPDRDIAVQSAPLTRGPNPWPGDLAAVWFCGFAGILVNWLRGWRRVSAIVSAAETLREGRAVEALGRLERRETPRLRIVSSNAKLEPGLFGIFRPVLWLPAGIGDHLSGAQLEAILAHELCHARRRDNLLAAIHMAVEAVFWFHPLVWWLGARLEEERERACDEGVVQMGAERQAYAEGVLKVCDFYLSSPLSCAAGVTGADLKKRIEGIMRNRLAQNLSFGKKAMLALAATLAIAGPIAVGLVTPPRVRAQSQAGGAANAKAPLATGAQAAKFEVASVKLAPDAPRVAVSGGAGGAGLPPKLTGSRFEYSDTVYELIVTAFRLNNCQYPDCVVGGPAWIRNDIYRIEAKFPEGKTYSSWEFNRGRAEAVNEMLQSLLADRFGLKAHRETRQAPVYEMTVASGGHKLTPNTGRTVVDSENGTTRLEETMAILPIGGWETGKFRMNVLNYTLRQLADNLSLDRPVLDRTGLSGRFDFTLEWQTEEPRFPPSPEALTPGIISAMAKQIGLRLEPAKGPVDVIAIDRIERPTGN
jgi:bla regulator protein blaR1